MRMPGSRPEKIDMEEALTVVTKAADVAKDRWFLHLSSLQGHGGQVDKKYISGF